MLTVDLSHIWIEADINEMLALEAKVRAAHETLITINNEKTSKTGWIDFPKTLEDTDLYQITMAADRIRRQSQAVVVIGAGGSYLGSRAVIELILSQYYNELGLGPKLYFAGHNLSSRELESIDRVIENTDFSVIVISKSGTTLEPALSFRHFRETLVERYGEKEAGKRIYAVTDKENGRLVKMAEAGGWTKFVIPDDIGGRYSAFTAAGLLPMAVAGISIHLLLAGAKEESRRLSRRTMDNPAWQYACARNLLYGKGKKIELLACYEPSFRYTAEWWKQLFGESEGKQGKGIFPTSLMYTTDLHSLGQYVQEGERTLIETLVRFDATGANIRVSDELADGDGLNYLSNRELYGIQTVAENAVIAAHTSGGVPVIIIEPGAITERNVGTMLYFFMFSCALSGLMLQVDPFDQPGVEAYKSNMFAMLKKE